MSDLIIHDPLANKLRAIAAQEQRPVEAVITTLLEQYMPAQDLIDEVLQSAGITIPQRDLQLESPLSEEEEQILANILGASGSFSEELIQERRASEL